MDSPLNITVSCFQNYRASDNPKPVNLMAWLTSAKYAEQVKQIRSIDDKSERDKIKATLPGITPSGTFTYREEKSLIEHSGLLQFDIDGKDHNHIGNFAELKKYISNINNVLYCGLSVSGYGYWGLVPIKHPDKHKSHFRALHKAFEKLGLNIDKAPQNVASLRGYSFDPDGYFNHNAKIFSSLDKPRPARKVKRTHFTKDTRSDVEALIEKIQASRTDITTGYYNWLRLGFAFAAEFGEAGRDYFHAVSQYHSEYNYREADRKYTSFLRSGKPDKEPAKIDSFFYLAKQYGILLHEGGNYHAENKDRRSTGKFEARQNEENANNSDYPASWDDIPAPEPGSQQDNESARAVVNDAAPDELEKLMTADPMIRQIVETFDAEMVVN